MIRINILEDQSGHPFWVAICFTAVTDTFDEKSKLRVCALSECHRLKATYNSY